MIVMISSEQQLCYLSLFPDFIFVIVQMTNYEIIKVFQAIPPLKSSINVYDAMRPWNKS